jgi:hypothetical protein
LSARWNFACARAEPGVASFCDCSEQHKQQKQGKKEKLKVNRTDIAVRTFSCLRVQLRAVNMSVHVDSVCCTPIVAGGLQKSFFRGVIAATG